MSEARPTPVLVEPFEEADRQHEAMTFGVWIFLATEILFFGGLFFLYAVARMQDPQGFDLGARKSEVLLGTINVALLLTSSATLTVAERASQVGWRAAARVGLIATVLLGLAFIGVKGFEYYEDLKEHLFPGTAAFPLGETGAIRFWCFYWVVTFIHAIHLSVGIGLVLRLLWLERKGRLIGRWMTVEATTLYWHFVDLIWILLWPLLYLVGR